MNTDDEQRKNNEFGTLSSSRIWRSRLGRAAWLIASIFFLQGMIGSFQEHEIRAAIIFGSLFALLLFGGIVTWVIERNQLL
jgi:hypothetical protein